jgi:lysozyme
MITGEKGLAIIKKWEGLRLDAYLCPSKIPTIGWGHTGPEVILGMKIDLAQAETYLKQDVVSAEDTVNGHVKVPLNQNQFDALVSFVFNEGSGNFIHSTLLKLLNVKLYDCAADQFPRWIYGADGPLEGLKKRRKEERELFLEEEV